MVNTQPVRLELSLTHRAAREAAEARVRRRRLASEHRARVAAVGDIEGRPAQQGAEHGRAVREHLACRDLEKVGVDLWGKEGAVVSACMQGSSRKSASTCLNADALICTWMHADAIGLITGSWST